MNILAIETSCDETSAAVVKDGKKVLSNIISSQIPTHEKYGGVVPEIASRMHVEAISSVTEKALDEAGVTLDQIDAIAVTYGPGLVGALLVGVSFAKALAYTNNIPLVGVHHLRGHIAANYITFPELKPPFLSLIVSGGHTHLVLVKDYTDFEIVGRTIDDAIGEAYDKVARILDLGYPGGPKIDKMAKNGKGTYLSKLPTINIPGNDFSFSGIKTAIINLNHNSKEPIIKEDLAYCFEKITTDSLISKAFKALDEYNLNDLVLAGGVSANSYIRSEFEKVAKQKGKNVYFPPISLCTDNAAMIASAGYYEYIAGKKSNHTLDAFPNLPIHKG